MYIMEIINDFLVPIYIVFDFNITDLKDINTKGVTVLKCSWYRSPGAIKHANSGIYPNVIILANTLEELSYFKHHVNKNVSVIYCNMNCFINENIFKISETGKRKYTMVLDSCFCKYKNAYLAKTVDNVLNIGYYKPYDITVMPEFGTMANFKDGEYNTLSAETVTELYNNSMMGGIFSSEEGACLASSQYLLCGLPVISISSRGGRHIWYNKDNSIICKSTPNNIKRGVEECLKKLKTGSFNREAIRNAYILEMREHRDRLIMEVCNKITVDYDKINKAIFTFNIN